jgi:hypothetical protein
VGDDYVVTVLLLIIVHLVRDVAEALAFHQIPLDAMINPMGQHTTVKWVKNAEEESVYHSGRRCVILTPKTGFVADYTAAVAG